MDTVSAAVVDQLRRTKGWALFIAILLWLGVFMLVGSGIVMLILPLIGSTGSMPPEFAGQMWIFGGLGVFYLIMSFLYVFPALKLTKFSMKISKLQESPTESGLIEILNEQRAFWKFVGIAFIVFIVLYIAIVAVAVVIAAAGAATAAGALN